MLDAHLWEQLEAHGLSQEHLEMLLRLLVFQKNGSWAWHFRHGSLDHCDLRVTFGPRRVDVVGASEMVVDGANMLR
jgi:hypothetical protein